MKKRYVFIGLAIVVVGVIASAVYAQYQIINSPDTSTISQPVEQTNVVTYDGRVFEPASVMITAGRRVYFNNVSTLEAPMYVASDVHPTHEEYPGFDAAVVTGSLPQKGESFSFVFDKPGTWVYHDHNNPTATGTVIVK